MVEVCFRINKRYIRHHGLADNRKNFHLFSCWFGNNHELAEHIGPRCLPW